MNLIRAFLPQIRALFFKFEKRQGRPPPPSSYAPELRQKTTGCKSSSYHKHYYVFPKDVKTFFLTNLRKVFFIDVNGSFTTFSTKVDITNLTTDLDLSVCMFIFCVNSNLTRRE